MPSPNDAVRQGSHEGWRTWGTRLPVQIPLLVSSSEPSSEATCGSNVAAYEKNNMKKRTNSDERRALSGTRCVRLCSPPSGSVQMKLRGF